MDASGVQPKGESQAARPILRGPYKLNLFVSCTHFSFGNNYLGLVWDSVRSIERVQHALVDRFYLAKRDVVRPRVLQR